MIRLSSKYWFSFIFIDADMIATNQNCLWLATTEYIVKITNKNINFFILSPSDSGRSK